MSSSNKENAEIEANATTATTEGKATATVPNTTATATATAEIEAKAKLAEAEAKANLTEAESKEAKEKAEREANAEREAKREPEPVIVGSLEKYIFSDWNMEAQGAAVVKNTNALNRNKDDGVEITINLPVYIVMLFNKEMFYVSLKDNKICDGAPLVISIEKEKPKQCFKIVQNTKKMVKNTIADFFKIKICNILESNQIEDTLFFVSVNLSSIFDSAPIFISNNSDNNVYVDFSFEKLNAKNGYNIFFEAYENKNPVEDKWYLNVLGGTNTRRNSPIIMNKSKASPDHCFYFIPYDQVSAAAAADKEVQPLDSTSSSAAAAAPADNEVPSQVGGFIKNHYYNKNIYKLLQKNILNTTILEKLKY